MNLIHTALYIINKVRFQLFTNSMKNVQQVQLSILNNLLRDLSKQQPNLKDIKGHQEFTSLPITDYQDYEKIILEQKIQQSELLCSQIIRYQPTSGSTSQIKWIPYNKSLLRDFDLAASIWMADMAINFPKIKNGKHYWSLSWLPNSLRSEQNLDDSEILSPVKKFLMQRFFAVPKEVMFTENIEDNLFGTVCFLTASKDLSFISVWSPTFLISLLETIENNKSEIIETLTTGKWSSKRKMPLDPPQSIEQAKLLKTLTINTFYKLWKTLALISCWDTAQSKNYALKLKSYFPHTPIQGKGLWSTEAVVTIPVFGKYCLSYQSHFYEFEEFETKKIYPSWQLEVGMKVIPIVSTPNGLLRYKMNDLLVVDSKIKQCPTLTFLGRIKDCDLVGEKLSHEQTFKLFEQIEYCCTPVSLIGVQSPIDNHHPYYILLVENLTINTSQLAQISENFLQQNYHYQLARDLNQLGNLKVCSSENAHTLYEKVAISKGMIKGNIKLEPLVITNTDDLFKDIL